MHSPYYIPSSHLENRSAILKRLILLRMVLLAGCLLVTISLRYFPGATINLTPLLAVLTAGVIWTAVIWLWYRQRRQISDWTLAGQLLVDVALLFALVWFSGRATNPFIYYLLVIIAVSASIFPAKILWAFSFGGIAIYTYLIYVDFNAHLQHMSEEFQLHLLGMWINFVGSALLISFFISRMTTALRDREVLLAAAREETLKNEQIIGIGTLAASTVHSLGTPLSTIAISVGELQEQQKNDAGSMQYLEIIRAQVDRCKNIMSKLSLLANNDAHTNTAISVGELKQDIQEYFLLVNAKPQPEFELATGKNLMVPGNLLLKHALINLIDNAVQAAKSTVAVQISRVNETLSIIIEDDGDGIPAAIVEQLGKPIASLRKDGLGIGIFLANSTIEKLNGRVRFYNSDKNAGLAMTKVVVDIPLHWEANSE